VISIEPEAMSLGVGAQEAAMDEPNSVEEYLAALPDDARATLEKVRQAIRAAAPTATESISYGAPVFNYQGRYLVYYAAFKNHCSLFPASNEVMETFAEELEPYDVSKGTIRFPIGKPLPATLVKKMVKARVRENEARRRR
jgi:uncharacterized protein YdhG (YjbR/CyaY superfamily)